MELFAIRYKCSKRISSDGKILFLVFRQNHQWFNPVINELINMDKFSVFLPEFMVFHEPFPVSAGNL